MFATKTCLLMTRRHKIGLLSDRFWPICRLEYSGYDEGWHTCYENNTIDCHVPANGKQKYKIAVIIYSKDTLFTGTVSLHACPQLLMSIAHPIIFWRLHQLLIWIPLWRMPNATNATISLTYYDLVAWSHRMKQLSNLEGEQITVIHTDHCLHGHHTVHIDCTQRISWPTPLKIIHLLCFDKVWDGHAWKFDIKTVFFNQGLRKVSTRLLQDRWQHGF